MRHLPGLIALLHRRSDLRGLSVWGRPALGELLSDAVLWGA